MSRSKQEDQAIFQKVQALKREGFPEKQATAIAFRMYREGELKRVSVKNRANTQKKVSAALKLLGVALALKRKKGK